MWWVGCIGCPSIVHLSFVYLGLCDGPTSPRMSLMFAVERTDSSSRSRLDRQTDIVRKDWGGKICGVTGAAGQIAKQKAKLERGSVRRREHVAWLPWAQCDLSQSHCAEQHKLSSFTTALRQDSPGSDSPTSHPSVPDAAADLSAHKGRWWRFPLCDNAIVANTKAVVGL